MAGNDGGSGKADDASTPVPEDNRAFGSDKDESSCKKC
jgi:hypothetical protein